MKMPWHNKTGLARVMTFSAVTFLVSTGLCGLNLAVYGHANRVIGTALMATGALELISIGVSAVILFLCGAVWVIREITSAFSKSDQE